MPYSKSPSPVRRRRSKSRERERERDRDWDRRRRRSRERKRRRSTERESHRYRGRSKSRSWSRSRSNSRERDRERDRVNKAKAKLAAVERPSIKEADLQGKTENEQEIMKKMGFCTFQSTKGKKVPGNENGTVHVILKRKYRQYMNRKGGFNRPLDFVA